MSVDLRVNIGRWQSVNDYMSVDNINDEALREIAQLFWVTSDKPADRATQVLIWDASNNVHNLIAVWT